MKRVVSILAVVLLTVFTAHAQKQATGPRIKFNDTNLHDFGTIQIGPQYSYDFKFTNTGTTPLIITNCMASCGCTTPEWPREPILPGKTGKISVHYNSAGHPGSFSKTVFVYSNAITDQPGVTDIHIIGNVIDKTTPPKKQ